MTGTILLSASFIFLGGCFGFLFAGHRFYKRGWWAGAQAVRWSDGMARRQSQWIAKLRDSERQNALNHIAQAIARGSIDVDDLAVIREHAPRVAQAMCGATGRTIGQLRHASAAHTLRIKIEDKA